MPELFREAMPCSSAGAAAADLNGSTAVAESPMGPSLTVRTINDDQQPSSGGWAIVSGVCYTLAGPRNQQYIVGGNVLHVQEPTRDTRHADAAPAAVKNAVNAAGGASAVSEPTNIEADPPLTADAVNAAGESSAVAESAPAATVVKDANSAASVAPDVAGTALATTEVLEPKIATQFADTKDADLDREDPETCSAAPAPAPGSMPTRPVPGALVHAEAANKLPPPPAQPPESKVPPPPPGPRPVAAVAAGGAGAAAALEGTYPAVAGVTIPYQVLKEFDEKWKKWKPPGRIKT